MTKVIRPEKERYNWLGCIVAFMVGVVPWIVFLFVQRTGSGLPLEEFQKFLLGVYAIALCLLGISLWRNWRSWIFRKNRRQFFAQARETVGTILEAQRVHTTRNYRVTTGREQSPYAYWRLKVCYRNEEIGEICEVFSEVFRRNPLEEYSIQKVSVYYTQTQAMVGDLKVFDQ